MLTSGKAVESQRIAFMDNDVIAFAKNAVNIKLSATGSEGDNNSKKLSEKDATLKFDEKVEEYKKQGFDIATAYGMVSDENPELVNAIEGNE